MIFSFNLNQINKHKKVYISSSDGGITVWIKNEDEKYTDFFNQIKKN